MTQVIPFVHISLAQCYWCDEIQEKAKHTHTYTHWVIDGFFLCNLTFFRGNSSLILTSPPTTHCFFSFVMWKSAASVLDHMSGCLCPCLHICVGWWWGNLSLTGTRCTSAAGRRQVNSAELDSHLWPGFPEVASGCCLGHICDRTFHIMENADEESNWRTVRDLFHLVGCSNHQRYHVPTWCLQWLVNCTLKLKEHTWFWSFKVEAVLVGEFEWPSALRFMAEMSVKLWQFLGCYLMDHHNSTMQVSLWLFRVV